MATRKVKVPVFGTVGKAVFIDPTAGDRALEAVEALAQAVSTDIGGAINHSSLKGLQVGDDHPQYTMWQAPETIDGQWNFATVPNIQGESLAEYIEDVVGSGLFDYLQDTPSIKWTYFDTDAELEANVDLDWAPVWTNNHRWTDNDEIQLGTGGDLHLYHDGTNSFIRNDTGALRILEGASQFAEIASGLMYMGVTAAQVGAIDGVPSTLNINEAMRIYRAAASPGTVGRRLNGTYAAPTAIMANDTMFQLRGSGYRTSASGGFTFGGDYSITALENFTSAAAGTRHRFRACAIGSASLSTVLDIAAAAVNLPLDNQELQLGAGNDLRLYHDGTNSFLRNDTGVLNINEGATTVGRFDTDTTAGNTRFMVYDVDNATLERVSVGAADSGGTGFKVLRIPN